MKHAPLLFATLLGTLLATTSAISHAFCGFYVGKADAQLFNEASQVIVVREGQKTVVSMLSDYKGDLKQFAVVVPVPTILKKEQVKVSGRTIFDRLDAYSAPRLAEYYDENPCEPKVVYKAQPAVAADMAESRSSSRDKRTLGVTVEASYTVGEYDIVILAAKESDGLETWLRRNGYHIPPNSAKALAPYIRQNMKFFVAAVNLKEQAKTGYQMLRPLQFSYESEKFMLPIRLGMANAKGPQDMIIYALTKNGRVETTNYRTVKLPANMNLPIFLKQGNEFRDFYKDLFSEQVRKENGRAVFTEYFWDMSWCDPCAAEPLSAEELRQAGVFWVPPLDSDKPVLLNRSMPPQAVGQPVMLTRLHVRYEPATFPEDLMFQETGDRQNFQTRYVLRHPFAVKPEACPMAKGYLEEVAKRQQEEDKQLATLTGRPIDAIRTQRRQPPSTEKP